VAISIEIRPSRVRIYGSNSYALQWCPNFFGSTAFRSVMLASADNGRRVFTGSETVTDVALRPG
jgi:hypothetical protein